MIVDDLHWLDLPSARVLSFVLRRLPPAPVSLLASVRTGWASGQRISGQRISGQQASPEQASPQPASGRPALATDALPPGRLDRLVLGPLSPGAAHELVTSRTPFRPGRRTLLSLVQLTGGNPMFPLELARAARRHRVDHQRAAARHPVFPAAAGRQPDQLPAGGRP
jgi:hypothetical protein